MLNNLRRKCKYFVIKLFRIKDNTHAVALGFSIGLLINFVPSFGLGPVLSMGVARVFRGNPVAGLLGGMSVIWIFPLLFYLNIFVGTLILPIQGGELLDMEGFLWAGLRVSNAFILGMIINMTLTGLLSYSLVHLVLRNFRKPILRYIQRVWNLERY